MSKPIVRKTHPDDLDAILALYPRSFPEEDLRSVVSGLLALNQGVLSLVGTDSGELVAHVLFTQCQTAAEEPLGALLAPLGVVPSHQRSGWGSLLVRDGLQRLLEQGFHQVFVLGDPDYYSRFGFRTEQKVMPPYDLPKEWTNAWQSLSLASRSPLRPGRLNLPDPWEDPKLWTT